MALTVGFFFREGSASAAACTWKNPAVDTSWSNSANWSVSGGASCPPTSGTAATFSAGSSPCTVDTAANVASLTINGYNGTITQSSSLTVSGTLNLSSGTFTQAAPLIISGAFTVNGGTFIGSSGTLTIDVNGSLNLMSGSFTSTNGRLEVAGSFNETGGTFNPNNGQMMLNSTSGTSTPGLSGTTFYDLVINDGLAAYWKLDETASPSADSSGYALGATWNQSPSGSTTVPAGVNFADSHSAFFGNNAADEAHFSSPALTQLTISAWIYEAGEPAGDSYPRVLDMPGFALLIQPSTDATAGENKRALDFISNRSTTNGDWQTGANSIAVGTWYHVAITYDSSSTGNTPTIYINGVSSGAVNHAPSGTQVSNVGTGYIGNRAAHDRVFDGYIDDLRIYSRLLSAADISRLAAGNQPTGSVATQSPSGALIVSHDLVIASGTLSTGSNAISVGGSWWNYGGVFTGTGTVTVNGTGTSNVIRSNGQSFDALSVAGSGTWTLGDALSMSTHSVTVGAGALTGLSYSILAGNVTESGGIFTPGTGAVTFDGVSDATVPDATYGSLTINTAPGLVGYWKLDEGTGTSFADSSGSGNSGSLLNGPTWSTSVSSSIQFTDPYSVGVAGGTDHGEVTVSSLNLNPTNGITLAYWVFYSSVPSSSQDTVVLASGASAPYSPILQTGLLHSAATGCGTTDCLGAWSSGGGGTPRAYTASPPSSGWHHFAYSWDGSNSNLYIDGINVDTRANAPTSSTVTKVLLSTYNGTSGEPFTGKLDDVRIYSRALTLAEVQRLANGLSSALPTYTLTGNTAVTGALAITAGGISVGSYTLTASSGATVAASGTITLASSGGTLAVGSGQSLIIDGTLKASSSGATIQSVSGSYAFKVGSTAAATPTVNVSGLAVKNTDANGMWINANTGSVTTFTKFDNIAFSSGTAGGELLQIYAKSLYLTSSGCTFDTGAAASTTYSVKLTGNGYTGTPDTTETRAIFGSSTCANDFSSCQASKSDDDTDNNGVGNTPASNGAVVQFVRAAATDTAGTIAGFPTAAFDWNTFTYYSSYAAYNSASGTSPVVYVRDGSGTAKYSWTGPAGETIVGTPRWNSVTSGPSTTHYLYVALASGKVYRLVDDLSSLTTTGAGWSPNPFDCSCTIVSPLAMDTNNLYWGGTTSGPVQKIWTLGQSSEAPPTGSPFTITPVITSAAPSLWTDSGGTSYLFIGLTGNIIEFKVSNQTLAATNTNPGSASVYGRIGIGSGGSNPNRVFAGDDSGKFWAIDPSNFSGSNKVWSYGVGGDSIKSSVYWDYGTGAVHFGTEAGKVVALDSSGAALTGFPYTPGTSSDAIRSALLYGSGVIAAGTTTGKLFFIDRNTGSGPGLIREYYFGPTESVSGISFDNNTGRYMVETADSSTKDGRLYYIDSISDPTPSST